MSKPTWRNKSGLAVAYGLPPNTPVNLVISRGLNMHAVNRATEVKKEYDANHPPAQERSQTKE